MITIHTVGQRWRYQVGGFDILAEITNLLPFETRIISANEYAISQGYLIGKVQKHGMGMERGEYSNWVYLKGQDKP